MKPNLLTAQEYDDLCYKFISEVEGYKATPYWDSENILTIGVGFNVDCPANNKNKDYSIYRKVVISLFATPYWNGHYDCGRDFII